MNMTDHREMPEDSAPVQPECPISEAEEMAAADIPEEDSAPAEPVPEPRPEEDADAEAIPEEAIEALADGFLLLRQEVPGMESIEDVPEAVLEMAAKEKLPLLDAYLRYRWREERAVEAERERQRRTGMLSAGSLYTGGAQSHPEADAFARAFAQALQ